MTRYATLTTDTQAIAPSGHGITIPAGTYEIAELDGVPDTLLYLCDRVSRSTLIGCIQASSATIEEKP